MFGDTGQGLGCSPEPVLCADFTLKALQVRMPGYLCIFSCATHQANVTNYVTSHRWLGLHVRHVSPNVFIHRRSAEKSFKCLARIIFWQWIKRGRFVSCIIYFILISIYFISVTYDSFLRWWNCTPCTPCVHMLRRRQRFSCRQDACFWPGCLWFTFAYSHCVWFICSQACVLARAKREKYPFLAEWTCHKLDDLFLVCYE